VDQFSPLSEKLRAGQIGLLRNLPSGTLQVLADGAVVGSAPVRLGMGAAVVDTTGLEVGRQDLTVTYSGDGRYAASSTTVRLQVLPAPSRWSPR